MPSLSVLIQTPTGKTFVSSGGKPITKTTNFRFASNTKNFTATAIMNVHEDGYIKTLHPAYLTVHPKPHFDCEL
ncbi:serine hydrolase [Spirosoma aerophilum]